MPSPLMLMLLILRPFFWTVDEFKVELEFKLALEAAVLTCLFLLIFLDIVIGDELLFFAC